MLRVHYCVCVYVYIHVHVCLNVHVRIHVHAHIPAVHMPSIVHVSVSTCVSHQGLVIGCSAGCTYSHGSDAAAGRTWYTHTCMYPVWDCSVTHGLIMTVTRLY